MRTTALLAAMATLLSGCSFQRFEHSRTVTQVVETLPLIKIDLKTSNGGIAIESHDSDTVEMEITFKAYGETEQQAQEYCEAMDCEITANDGLLTMRTTKPAAARSTSASYVLKVPATCQLKLASSNGTISVANMDAQIEVDTSNGKLLFDNVRGAIMANTSNGRVEVNHCSGPIDLTTSNGAIAYQGQPTGSSNTLTTSNGRIEVNLPEDQNVEIDSKTSNGSIRCSLPTQEILSESKKKLHAIVGSGGSLTEPTKLSLRTSNGSITIEPMPDSSAESQTDATTDATGSISDAAQEGVLN